MFLFQRIWVLGLVSKQPIKQTWYYLLSSAAWFCMRGERPISPQTKTPTLFIYKSYSQHRSYQIKKKKLSQLFICMIMTKILTLIIRSFKIIIQLSQSMLFSTKKAAINNRSKTPTKSQPMFPSTAKQFKKEVGKNESAYKEKPNGKENASMQYKTNESYQILQTLQEIYNDLDFNDYDVFPLDNIEKAKKNIENLLLYLGDQPICRQHKDILNLYCDNDKSVVCVSCVYKSLEHKGHKVKCLQSVEKTLDFQTLRFEEKTKGLVHQLNQLKDQMNHLTKRIGENYMMISKYTVSIIDTSIKELNALKVDMQKKISLAYRRTTTVINRYSQSLELLSNHLQDSLQKTTMMNALSKHLLLKQLSLQNELIQKLVGKFNQNRTLMQQWYQSNQSFQKLVLKKSNSINTRVDSFVVTQF